MKRQQNDLIQRRKNTHQHKNQKHKKMKIKKKLNLRKCNLHKCQKKKSTSTTKTTVWMSLPRDGGTPSLSGPQQTLTIRKVIHSV